MASPLCGERIRLSQAIAQAVKDVDVAKADQDHARKEQTDIEPYTVALAEARKQARLLVVELDQHQKEHAC